MEIDEQDCFISHNGILKVILVLQSLVLLFVCNKQLTFHGSTTFEMQTHKMVNIEIDKLLLFKSECFHGSF